MATSYEIFYENFLNKVLEYHYADFCDNLIESELLKYLCTSLSQFKHYCKDYNFNDRDDENGIFNFNFKTDDVDEIVDIVTDGMVVSWFNKYICNSDGLENVLTTRDFALYSPANLNFRNRETYEMLRKAFVNKMREYSFTHNGLDGFHSG